MTAKKCLDTISEKRGRGRHGVGTSEIAGRAYRYRLLFRQNWKRVGEPLLRATSEEEVIEAFGKGTSYQREFKPVAPLILEVLRDPDFPKRNREAQINFLADSLAAFGEVSPRRSRDICAKARTQEKHAHHIIRHEYYVECSCGYKGPALDNACRECGAEIPLSFQGLFSYGLY